MYMPPKYMYMHGGLIVAFVSNMCIRTATGKLEHRDFGLT